MKYDALVLSAFLALTGTQIRADTFVTITPTGSTAATVANRWAIGGGLSGLGYIGGNSGFPGATATNFFTITGAAIGPLGDPTGFTSYLPTGAPTAQGSVGNSLRPDSYSGLTYVAANLSLIGPLSFYAIHHRVTGDYLALIQPSVPTVSDQKPMSLPGGPNTAGGTGYFALSYASDDPGNWGANLFYYLRTDALTGHTWFGSLIPALLSGPTDRWDLGVGRGFTDLAYTTTDVGFGFGPSQFYYLRLDPITHTTFFGRINPQTGVATDIQDLGGVYRTLTFTPTDVAYGANKFYSIGSASLTAQTITFGSIPNHSACDSSFTFVYPTASSGLAVTLGVSGPATVSGGNLITLTGTAGTVVLTASQAGNSTFATAPIVAQSFTIGACGVVPTPQTITFAAVPSHGLCDGAFTVSPTASSGLPVALAVTSGPATVSGNTVTLTGIGNVTLQATQAGNTIYSGAPPVSQTFAVAACVAPPTPQTITFAAVPSHGLCDGAFTVSPTASSGLPVTLAVTSGPATVSGNTVTLTGEGTVTLQATQAGDTTYSGAPPVSQTFATAKCDATVYLGDLANTYHRAPYEPLRWLATTTPAGLTVITTYNGSTTAPVATGTYTVVGTIDSPLYRGSATTTFFLSPDIRAAQTVSFGTPAITDHVFGDAPFTLNPTASSGFATVLAVASGPARVSGNTVTMTGPGTVVLQLTQAGDIQNYFFAYLSQSFTVAKAVSRIVNFSTRAFSSPNSPLIMGFVVAGNNESLLVRGIGPALTSFGITNPLADPLLAVSGAGGTIATNDDWQVGNDGSLIAATAAGVGAFPLPNGSKDSALLVRVNSGAYTAGLARPDGSSGTALAEIYDTDMTAAARLVNVSARMSVTSGDGALFAGLVIAGNTSKTVLIRAVGPTLSLFGVGGALADPMITVFSGNTPIASNDNWETGASTAAQIIAASAKVGAFALPAGGKDAVLLLTLQPGAYSVKVTGVGDTAGVVLIEVYDTQ